MIRPVGLLSAAAALLLSCGPRSLVAVVDPYVGDDDWDAAVVDVAAKPLVDAGNDIALPSTMDPMDECSGPPPRDVVADLPPMGWNGWNFYNCNAGFNAASVMAVADAMLSNGMAKAGYRYVNVDDCWAASARGTDGVLIPDPARYPDGIAAVAEYVHNRGLELGIYSATGPCHEPQSIGHEQLDVATFARWGSDYLKYNQCVPAADAETSFKRMASAVAGSGRPMVFAISPDHFEEWMPYAAPQWRTMPPITPTWDSILSNVDTNAHLAPYTRRGARNDPDMLEVGNGALTDNENRAHFTLWAALSAPLLAGNDLPRMSETTRQILTNEEVIAIDQDALGLQAARIRNDATAKIDVFAKPLSSCGARAVVILNRGTAAADVHVGWDEVWLGMGPAKVRDLWQHAEVPSIAGGITVTVQPRDVVALKVVGEEAPIPKGDVYLSDLPFTYAQNYWGPVERDSGNGEQLAHDGTVIRLKGIAYGKGLGVHGPALVRFRLGGNCTRFTCDVGIDDETGGSGAAQVEIWSDGDRLFDGGVLTGGAAPKHVDIDVTSRRDLVLFAGNGGDGVTTGDHVDWASAQLHCKP